MRLIDFNNRLRAIPENWNELTRRQLLQVMKVLYGHYEMDAGRLMLLKIILGVGWYRWCRTPILYKHENLDRVEFLLAENTLSRQLIREFKGYYGPDDDFNNITGEEFVFSEDAYFSSFTRANKSADREIHEEGLNKLVAVLFRQKKPGYNTKLNVDGDPRMPFNQNISNYNADRVISKWPMHVKLAVFTWYECCRQEMIEQNPDVFGGGNSEPAKYGLLSVMRVIAESGIHGDFEKVQKMYVKMWMVELNEKAEEIKREEKAFKK